MSSTRRFEFVGGGSSKFWQITLDGATYTVTFGRIGTAGQSQTKTFGSAALAEAEHDKVVREKVGKGYREVEAPASPPASAATSKPRPAPAPARASAPAPTPASAATPATAAQPATLASSEAAADIDDPPRVIWTPEARLKLQPQRPAPSISETRALAYSGPPPWEVIQQAWNNRAPFVAAGLPRASTDHQAITQAVIRSAALPAPSTADVTVEAARAALLAMESPDVRPMNPNSYEGDRYYRRSIAEANALAEALLESWTQLGGLAFAVDTTVSALLFEPVYEGRALWIVQRDMLNRFVSHDLPPLWRALRARLCAAPDQEYEQARAKAAQWREPAEGLVRCSMAYLFPANGDWADADARDASQGRLDGLTRLSWLLPSIGTPAAGLAMIKAEDYEPFNEAPFAMDLVERLGPDAFLVLHAFIKKANEDDYRGDIELWKALALVDSNEALSLLTDHLDDREIQPHAIAAFTRSPRRAIRILARNVASGRAKGESVLRRLVNAHPGIANGLLPRLNDRERRVIERMQPATAAVTFAEASAGELPAVLARPPWREKRPRRTRAIVRDLVPITVPDRIVWAPGQRERWLRSRWSHVRAQESGQEEEEAEVLADFLYRRDRGHVSLWLLDRLSDARALELWNTVPSGEWRTSSYDRLEHLFAILARFGLDALPGFLAFAAVNLPETVPALMPVCSARVAPLMAEALARLKSARSLAQRWLEAFPREASLTLIPAAVGERGKAQAAAEGALRFLATRGHEPVVRAAAAEYGDAVSQAVDEALTDDALFRFPSRIPAAPVFWNPAALPPPLLRDRQKVLPPAAIDALGDMLRFSSLDEPYAGLAHVRDACDRRSLGEFAWAVFSAWEMAGMPAKEEWAFQSLGHLGDDEVARLLTPLIRKWPSVSQLGRATRGLDVLRLIGSDAALLQLYGISQKVKSRPLRLRAAEKMQNIAEDLELTPEELADRLVPDLGLDSDGARTLDFGARRFRVGFDEQLRPFILDAEGARLKDLPDAGRADDPEKSAHAALLWKTLKADARKLAKEQVARLERAMCHRRRWNETAFQSCLVQHPWLIQLVRRLVWGIYDDTGTLTSTFRVAEDRSLADIDDRAITLSSDARIGLVHRLDMDAADVERWSATLGDYKILQPFPQLGRPIHRRTADEAAQTFIAHVEGVKVPSTKVLGLEARGWRKETGGDGGWVSRLIKSLPSGHEAQLLLNPGLHLGDVTGGEQTLERVVLSSSSGVEDDDAPPTMADIDEITYSEIVTDVLALKG